MSYGGPAAAPLAVGRARFDAATRRLTLGGKVVPLEHRPAELLILLLARAGQTVPKNEILDRLWPGRAVTEASLTKCVRQLRLALGDDDHTLIRTVHGQGFRIETSCPMEAAERSLPRTAADAAPCALGRDCCAADHRRDGGAAARVAGQARLACAA
jgi:DNA-binding winged helix-turn-helix (wHTH) protein